MQLLRLEPAYTHYWLSDRLIPQTYINSCGSMTLYITSILGTDHQLVFFVQPTVCCSTDTQPIVQCMDIRDKNNDFSGVALAFS